MTDIRIRPADFNFVRDLVRSRSGIVLEPGKEYLVETRLLPVARTAGDENVARFISRLRSAATPALLTAVVEALTTNETSWFRDRHPYDALRDHVLPELMARPKTHRRISVWSAACSSGQEPYSIAMVLADAMANNPGWSADIVATDLSNDILAQARSARYSQREMNRGLPAALLVRHFERAGTHWALREPIRKMVSFRALNLAVPLPTMTPVDIVFLRNVLIYFDAAMKRQVLAQVRRVLRPDGYLFLGGAETTLHLDDEFERSPLGATSLYRLRKRKAA
jgi:chemotaxis protein methyltransferase CheR